MGVSIDRLKECLSYDPCTGLFVWIKPSSRRVHVGDVAGNKMAHGYITIRIDGCAMLAHRAAWAITYGVWPTHEVDHINRIRDDNRIVNLREATRSLNARNSPARVTNRLGVKGVRKKYNRYIASIWVDGRANVIGRYNTAEKAGAAYEAARADIIKRTSTPIMTDVNSEQTFYGKQLVKAIAARPSIDELHKRFDYHSDGRLTWKSSPCSSVAAGSEVGTPNSDGYLVTTIGGFRIFVHHIVWAMHHGWIDTPSTIVGYINGIRRDNRIENLYLTTRKALKACQPPTRANPTGVRGVQMRNGKFRVAIMDRGRNTYLGRFATIEEAKKVYEEAHIRIHGHPSVPHNALLTE